MFTGIGFVIDTIYPTISYKLTEMHPCESTINYLPFEVFVPLNVP